MTSAQFRAHREALGLTQAQLARAMGYGSQTRISEIESRAEVPPQTALLMRAFVLFGLPDAWPGCKLKG
jgi:transcriptional regulator with XRE-family HTH domain